MTPNEHFRAGNLDGAIAALGEELRSRPFDPKRRTFLFELLCFAGQYGRAEKQLDVLADQATGPASAGLLAYRSALHAQRTREEMFASGKLPPPSEMLALPGRCNGMPYVDFEDADPRLGTHLEVFLAGEYAWVPLAFVQSVQLEAPETLRDLLWARGRLVFVPSAPFQDLGEVFFPALTPLAHRHADYAVRLGRATEWESLPDGTVVPAGQKMLLIDGEDLPFLELRSLEPQASPEQAKDRSDAGA